MRRLTYKRPPAAALLAQARLVAGGFLRHAVEDGSWQDRQHSALICWVRDARERAVVVTLIGQPDADGDDAPVDDALDRWRERLAPGCWVLGRTVAVPRGAKHVVRLPVGAGFGLGDHPTTRCAAVLLTRSPVRGKRVLDLGCGTGVLTVLAGQLGAQVLEAVDLDPDAVKHTRRTLAANAISGRVWISNLLRKVPEAYDVVIANLISDLLIELFATQTLAARVARSGRVLCSGIRADRRRDVEAAADGDGWRVTERTWQGEWVGLVLQR
jgi:ribosomal protein L11 methylase PrmA